MTTRMKPLDNMQAYVGKTIASIEDTAVNCKVVTFDDGSVLHLEAENIYPSIGLIGIQPYEVTEVSEVQPL